MSRFIRRVRRAAQVLAIATPVLGIALGIWYRAHYVFPSEEMLKRSVPQPNGYDTILAGLVAVPLAWATVRTDMPGRTFVRLGVLAAFITPPYLGAVGWILLAGPNAGWLNKIWIAATGADAGLFNIFSLAGLILVIYGSGL